MQTVYNWARTYSSTPAVLRYIDTVDDLADGLALASQRGARVRVLGAAQSPSDIAMSKDHLLVMRGLKRVREINRERCEVVAEAGITLGALATEIGQHGLALPNLGSILRQTLGGAAATGTHGTGVGHGSVPSWIQSFEMLTVDGAMLRAGVDWSPGSYPDLFAGGRLSLGSLGVHSAFRIQVVEAFDLRVEEGPVSLAAAMEPEWYDSADHARVWYLPYVDHAWGWRAFRVPRAAHSNSKTRRDSGPAQWIRKRAIGYHGFQAGLWLAASFPSLLPVVNRAYSSVFFSQPRYSSGGSVEQFTFDCLFHQRVSEWAVPLANAREAALGIREMAEQQGFHAHLPIEIRYTAGDDMWLSPTYGGPRCWIGVVSYIPYGREVTWQPWFAAVEELMLRFRGRPHWAKEFLADSATFQRLYPKWNEFARLRAMLDPEKRLSNAYTDRVFDEP